MNVPSFILNLKLTRYSLLIIISLLFSPPPSYSAYAVISAHPLATQAGEKVLEQGGNAFDAAVAVSAALAVVEPYASGLGGGGFWLLYRAHDQHTIMIDSREAAPGNANADMFLNSTGKPDRLASLRGARAAAIPGTPAAMAHITEKYGQLPLSQNLKPAIHLARDGFLVDKRLARALDHHHSKLKAEPDSARIFLPNDKAPSAGTLFRQPQLAATLSYLAIYGRDGFYRGDIAQELVQTVQTKGGIWTLKDLSDYQIIEREPVSFTYNNTRITTTNLPSAGGITLAQALNILEYFQLPEIENDSERTYLIIEAMRRAYEDRAKYLGDSDFVSVDTKKLTSKNYALSKAKTINTASMLHTQPHHSDNNKSMGGEPKKPTPQPIPTLTEGTNTTHFSVIDHEGNRVAATLSINTFFGSGLVAGNTGVLLNNEMDDFTIAPDVPNIYGLVGSKANAIAPGKRPLSSMSPTFLENEQGILTAGTPGGSRIISTLLLTAINFTDWGETDPEKLVAAPRYHHQHIPDQVEIEPDAFDESWIQTLEAKKYTVKTATRRWGNMQLIYYDKQSGDLFTASDPRSNDYVRY